MVGRAEKKIKAAVIRKEEKGGSVQIIVDGNRVDSDNPGLDALTCTCPAAGPCVHKIMAVFWLREQKSRLVKHRGPERDAIDQRALRNDIGKSLAKKAFTLISLSKMTLQETDDGKIRIVFNPGRVMCTFVSGQYWGDIACSLSGDESVIYKAASILFYLRRTGKIMFRGCSIRIII